MQSSHFRIDMVLEKYLIDRERRIFCFLSSVLSISVILYSSFLLLSWLSSRHLLRLFFFNFFLQTFARLTTLKDLFSFLFVSSLCVESNISSTQYILHVKRSYQSVLPKPFRYNPGAPMVYYSPFDRRKPSTMESCYAYLSTTQDFRLLVLCH